MSEVYDVCIIGGGVVGCSVLFELTNHGYKCVLLEKNPNLLEGASCGNSGMLHTGFDADPNSLELRCIQLCQRKILDVFNRLGLPYSPKGARMIAWNEKQKNMLPAVIRKSQTASISKVEEISISSLYQQEPYLNKGACAALWIPGETILDPWLTPAAFAHHSKIRGAEILTNCEVQGFEKLQNNKWQIHTNNKNIYSRVIINCAGLYGDRVDGLVNQQSFRIKPRKGQYLVYDKTTQHLINSSILPVPTEKTKGVIVFKTVYDNVLVGPTAEEVDEREGFKGVIDPLVTERLLRYAHETVPLLQSHRVVQTYSGIRPATQHKDHQIKPYPERNWITVGGIRSTGVSGSIGIAEVTRNLLEDSLKMEPSRACFPNLEKLQFQYLHPGMMKICDEEYKITHPITLCGHSPPYSQL